MPEQDDNSTPATLADLWLRSKSARGGRTESPARPTPERGSQMALMDLLFAAPVADEELAVEERAPVAPQPANTIVERAPVNKSAPVTAAAEGIAASVPVAIPERHVWTIRDLVSGVRRQLEREYDDIWVEGEISNCRPAASG